MKTCRHLGRRTCGCACYIASAWAYPKNLREPQQLAPPVVGREAVEIETALPVGAT